jgi:hypothetical protein
MEWIALAWMQWRELEGLHFVDGVGVLAAEGDGAKLWIRPAFASLGIGRPGA